MNTLSLSIPFSGFEIDLLLRGVIIAALPKLYLKGKSFLLYPLNDQDLTSHYHPQFNRDSDPQTTPNDQSVIIKSWARCELCERVQSVQDLERLTQSTIWTNQGLKRHLGANPHLFLAYLRVYRLPQPMTVNRIENDQDKAGKFIGLNPAIAIDGSQPVLTEDQFDAALHALKERQPIITLEITPLPEPERPKLEAIAPPEPEPKAPPIQPEITPDTLRSPEPETVLKPATVPQTSYELTQIAEVGNSSHGHEFERLIRKGLLFLGFQNSEENPKASLNPDSTGGAGGLDFYANYPYPIVGECKATKTEKVPDGTPAQLVKLGHKILKSHYQDCIKIVVAAGELTNAANETASGNQINVLRPETIQRLVCLKQNYPGAVNLFELKHILESEPFSEAVDAQVNHYIDAIAGAIQTRSNLIALVKEQPQPPDVTLLQGIYIGRYSSSVDLQELHQILVELASPLTGYLGRRKGEQWKEDRFYFVREFDHLLHL
jgi:hypothetical protein